MRASFSLVCIACKRATIDTLAHVFRKNCQWFKVDE